VQRPQRVVQRRALKQQPRHGGHHAAATAPAAAAAVAGRVHVHAVADGRRTATPGQLRGPADRGHGGHPAQGRPGGQGPDASRPVHQAHERVAQLVHGTAGRQEPARVGARLEDDAAQRRAAAAPSPRQGAVALSPVPAAATAAEPEQLPAAPTAVVVVVQRRRRRRHRRRRSVRSGRGPVHQVGPGQSVAVDVVVRLFAVAVGRLGRAVDRGFGLGAGLEKARWKKNKRQC